MASSAEQYFHAYVRLAQEPVEKILVELGRIAKELRQKWSENETRDFIVPLLKPLIDPKVFADREFVRNAVVRRIRPQGRGASWYQELVLERIQKAQSCAEEGRLR